MSHVLVGTNEPGFDYLLRAAAESESVRWLAPSRSRIGDAVLFFIPAHGIVGSGAATGPLTSTMFRNRHTYKADVGSIMFLPMPVPTVAEMKAFLRTRNPVHLTQGKRAVAALEPLRNVDRESLALSQHPEFLDLIDGARAEFSAGRTISMAEMKHRVLPKRAPNNRVQPKARKAHRG